MTTFARLLALTIFLVPSVALAASYRDYETPIYHDQYTHVYDGRQWAGYHSSAPSYGYGYNNYDIDYGTNPRATRVYNRGTRYRSYRNNRNRYYSNNSYYNRGIDCWRERHHESRCYDYDDCDYRDVRAVSTSTVYCSRNTYRYPDLKNRYSNNYRRNYHTYPYYNSRNKYDSYYYNDGYRNRNSYHYYNY